MWSQGGGHGTTESHLVARARGNVLDLVVTWPSVHGHVPKIVELVHFMVSDIAHNLCYVALQGDSVRKPDPPAHPDRRSPIWYGTTPTLYPRPGMGFSIVAHSYFNL